MLNMLSPIMEIGTKLIDRIFPDKNAADQAKLKLIELQQQGELKQLEADLRKEELAFQDRHSAREREAKMAAAGARDWTPTLIAVIIVLGFLAGVFVLMKVDIDVEAKGAVQIMVGSLGTAVITIINYYFGTSSSSRKKDDIIFSLKSDQNIGEK